MRAEPENVKCPGKCHPSGHQDRAAKVFTSLTEATSRWEEMFCFAVLSQFLSASVSHQTGKEKRLVAACVVML